MAIITLCKICARSGSDKLQSSLGSSPICHECFEKKAERIEVLHQAALSAYRTKVAIPSVLKRQMTIIDADFQYVPIEEWYDLKTKLPVVVHQYDPEIEDLAAMAQQVADKIKKVNRKRDFWAGIAPTKKPSVLERLRNYWRAALDIDYPNAYLRF